MVKVASKFLLALLITLGVLTSHSGVAMQVLATLKQDRCETCPCSPQETMSCCVRDAGEVPSPEPAVPPSGSSALEHGLIVTFTEVFVAPSAHPATPAVHTSCNLSSPAVPIFLRHHSLLI